MTRNVFATHAHKGQLVTASTEAPDHDLPHFTHTTAAIIAAAWTASRDQTDADPIRQHWRENPALRVLIAELMTGTTQEQ